MDSMITNWIVEFLARQPLEEPELYSIIRSLPLRNRNLNLNKSLLLSKLESVASEPPLLDGTLFLLGKLNEIEFQLGKKASDAMKRAYCAVAVDFTLRPLKHGDDNDAESKVNFLERVKSVWRGRFKQIEKDEERRGLWSEQLREWKKEIKAAVWESNFRSMLLDKFDEVEAEEAVRAYLSEERQKLPPTFLKLLAERVKTDEVLQKIMDAATGSNGSKEMQTGENCGETKIVDTDETAEELHSDSAQVNKVAESLELSSTEAREVVKDPVRERQDPAEENNTNVDGVDQSTGGNVSNARKRPSLMERNNSVQTFKWDDSAGGSPEGIACRQKRIKASSSKKICDGSSSKKRRKVRRWSLQEEEALRKAVDEHGVGFWKLILETNQDTFEGRTQVDLKDKWRNLTMEVNRKGITLL